MGEKQQFEVWKDDMEPVLVSKVEEFHMLGYDKATKDEIWRCVTERLHKKKSYVPFYTFTDELLNLKVSVYMTWLTVNSYKEPENWFSDFEEVDQN
ncbi:post-transcriptional regulator [Alkalicoccobacillus plakortidis]|uniref:Post-transcriptional regulator n=1 Tax=Alkalicoccobacillus plakortidis TaxID=444060 RepID=A0ABT0XL25_9BACI|nr:post-transcriptional regulator [Alkalicoccobacillus plakortidis]MCM2676537.1 post-transcriptional regulator [Alkalicoccobacillus plakortidis]